jgi:uncharacterized protein YdeI (YjbR/CyaY-like superfamily)
MKPIDIRHFASAAAFRAWLRRAHARSTAQWVAIAKKNATEHVLPHRDALDTALAFGWIDGFVSKLDATHYALRFTPRKPGSNWSAVNVKRYGELLAAGRIEPAGRAAFDQRDRRMTEERPAELTAPYLKVFRHQPAAWRFFSGQPPGYRRQMSWYVLSAKTEPTRQRRLQALMDASAAGQRLGVTGGAVKQPAPTAAGSASKPVVARTTSAAGKAVKKPAKAAGLESPRLSRQAPARAASRAAKASRTRRSRAQGRSTRGSRIGPAKARPEG